MKSTALSFASSIRKMWRSTVNFSPADSCSAIQHLGLHGQSYPLCGPPQLHGDVLRSRRSLVELIVFNDRLPERPLPILLNNAGRRITESRKTPARHFTPFNEKLLLAQIALGLFETL